MPRRRIELRCPRKISCRIQRHNFASACLLFFCSFRFGFDRPGHGKAVLFFSSSPFPFPSISSIFAPRHRVASINNRVEEANGSSIPLLRIMKVSSALGFSFSLLFHGRFLCWSARARSAEVRNLETFFRSKQKGKNERNPAGGRSES